MYVFLFTVNTSPVTFIMETLRLQPADGEIIEVHNEVAVQANTIKNLVDDLGTGKVIPLPNVKGDTLKKVIEYLQFHLNADKSANTDESETAKKDFNDRFINIPQGELFDLILAANYLNVKGLLDLTCTTVSMMLKGKTPEEIRKTFNIKNDFTPEEEEDVRRENQWAFM